MPTRKHNKVNPKKAMQAQWVAHNLPGMGGSTGGSKGQTPAKTQPKPPLTAQVLAWIPVSVDLAFGEALGPQHFRIKGRELMRKMQAMTVDEMIDLMNTEVTDTADHHDQPGARRFRRRRHGHLHLPGPGQRQDGLLPVHPPDLPLQVGTPPGLGQAAGHRTGRSMQLGLHLNARIVGEEGEGLFSYAPAPDLGGTIEVKIDVVNKPQPQPQPKPKDK